MERWYVAQTQPQKEETARAHLCRQGFVVYLPRWRKRRSHARRVDWVPAPLFPRYLFIGFDLEVTRWRSIQSTVGVSHLVCNGGLPVPVPEGIVEEIQAREAADGFVSVKSVFRKGQAVVMESGPFLDQVGLFEQIEDAERVTILLQLLGRDIRVTTSAYSVRAVA